MLRLGNGWNPSTSDATERDKAKAALAQMKQLEREMRPRMFTVVLPNGTIISHTNENLLYEYVRLACRKIRTV